jgi:hypothetical protein
MMSQQDYKLIASVLKDCLAISRSQKGMLDCAEAGVWFTIEKLAEAMGRQRWQFSREKFMKAIETTTSTENVDRGN